MQHCKCTTVNEKKCNTKIRARCFRTTCLDPHDRGLSRRFRREKFNSPAPFCTPEVTQCPDVSKEVCEDVPREECKEVPREVCKNVERGCRNIPERKCRVVPTQQCHNVAQQVCGNGEVAGEGYLNRNNSLQDVT